MKSRIFVVFSKDNVIPPKLYKKENYSLKKCTYYPTYTYETFTQQSEAKKFLNQKLVQTLKKHQQIPESARKAYLQLQKNQQTHKDQSDLTIHKYIEQAQKQYRQKIIRQILLQNRFFRDPQFKSTDAKIPLDQPYYGYFHGAYKGNPSYSAVGYHIDNKDKKTVLFCSQFIGKRTNIQAEMMGLILMLSDAYCNGIKDIHYFGDSLATRQLITGEYKPYNQYYCQCVSAWSKLNNFFEKTEYTVIGSGQNFVANKLASQILKNNSKPNEKSKKDQTENLQI